MRPVRRSSTIGLVVMAMTVAAGCGETAPTSPTASPSQVGPNLSVTACATEDPFGVGELTGAWQADTVGVYYIRQIGDCVWWFATELEDVDLGATGLPGFANVASGRVEGAAVDVEWADIPMGDILNGGGLTLVYDRQNDQLRVTEQRGEGVPFGAATLTRIQPDGTASPTPSAPATP